MGGQITKQYIDNIINPNVITEVFNNAKTESGIDFRIYQNIRLLLDNVK